MQRDSDASLEKTRSRRHWSAQLERFRGIPELCEQVAEAQRRNGNYTENLRLQLAANALGLFLNFQEQQVVHCVGGGLEGGGGGEVVLGNNFRG